MNRAAAVEQSSYTDNELINRVCHKDQQALELLLERYQKKTLFLVHRYVNSAADVQDISQEVLIRLFQSIQSFKHGSSFNTWHYRIVMNTINSYFRSPHQRFAAMAVNCEDFDDLSSNLLSDNDPQQLLIAEEMVHSLLNAFEQMPQHLNEAIILFEIEGLSYEQISAKLNCPIGTVRSRIHRARSLIEKKLDL